MKKLLLNAIFIVIFALYGMSSLTAKPLGYHYILGFPANDKEESNKDIIAIYVASEYNGTFQLKNGLTGLNKSFEIKAGDVTRLTTKDGDASWDWENRTIGKAEPKGIEIISDVPISVNVLIGKSYTSEGYTAIPVEAWGKKYIHNSYYDFNESRPWRTEFLIIASEDNTIINVNLKGMPEGAATADPNWKIGQTKTIKLNKYETYLVQGDGLTRGLFDMSGTEITADKPIAIISGHERCMIPKNIVYNGRDNLLAMLPPVDNWGKEYYTIELDRGTDRGDYYRVVASEDSTDVDISWYDKKTKEKINSILYKNLEAGEWVEYHTVDADYTTYQESIRGVSHFKANNPILVCQYAYSAYWDSRNSRFDPFYFPLTSVEQFVHTTVFQAPSNKSGNDYVENYLNIIAIGDTSDIYRNEEILSSITIDGKTVRSYMDEFITNRIPGSNLYWATVRLAQGPHIIEGDTKFGGYIYGFGMYNSYAWPIHSANLDLTSEEFDYLPPKVVKKQNNNGRFDINIIDNTSYQNDDSVQTDAGVDKFPKVVSQENFSKFESGYFQLSEEENDPPRLNNEWRGETDTDLHIFAEVKDKKNNAKLIFKAKDVYGNFQLDSIEYITNSVEYFKSFNLSPNPVNGDILNLEYELLFSSEVNISIIDLNGNSTLVESGIRAKLLNKDIDVSNLTKGVYFLKIDINGKSIKKKFIKE